MNPLLITTLFLVLLSFFSFNAQKRVNTLFYLENLHQSRDELTSLGRYLEQRAYFEDRCDEKSKNDIKPEKTIDSPKKRRKPKTEHAKTPPRSKPLKYDFSRPPKESRLNIKSVVSCKASKKTAEINPYQSFARLLRSLYSEHPQFRDSPDIEYRLIEELVLHSEQIKDHMSDADDLSTLKFKNEEMQKLFYFLLKGGSIVKTNSKGLSEIVYFPSLLSYISIHRFTKINLLFAAEEIVHAIIPYPDVASDIFTARKELWKQILDQESRRKDGDEQELPLTPTTIKEQFRDKILEILAKKGLENNKELTEMLSYDLKKPGNLLIIRDEKTGILECKKIVEAISIK